MTELVIGVIFTACIAGGVYLWVSHPDTTRKQIVIGDVPVPRGEAAARNLFVAPASVVEPAPARSYLLQALQGDCDHRWRQVIGYKGSGSDHGFYCERCLMHVSHSNPEQRYYRVRQPMLPMLPVLRSQPVEHSVGDARHHQVLVERGLWNWGRLE